ncbi:conserved hypothetical protein [metagenome]|uniref:Ferric siderophore reductase C-terminal domain-containing protein n=1 Tax=metagenome TaxID=256318 RepID=A0A2P2C1B5_9ZZZZ
MPPAALETLLTGLPVVVRSDSDPLPDGWVALHQLTRDPVGFAEFADGTRQALVALGGADLVDHDLDRSARSLSVLRIAGGLVMPTLAIRAAGGSLRLDPADTWVTGAREGLLLSVPPGDVLPGGSPDCADLEVLLRGHLTDLVTTAASRSLSSAALWGNVASVVNSSANLLGARHPDLGAAGRDLADQALGLPQLAGRWLRTDGGGFRRTTCCLAFSWAAGLGEPAPCGDCVQRH